MIHKKAEESWTNAHENNLAGQFPLHHACRDGNSEELQRLLTELQNNVSNAEILIAEDPYYNWTAGHFAAYFGNLDCLRLLMQASSVYNSSRASSGLPPLPCPLAVPSSRCHQSLLQVAAFANHPQCVQWLLQAAQGLDSQDVNGETALHKACRSGSWECAQLLVACRANTIVRNDNGLTPSELAASCGHGRLADQLGGLCGGKDTKTVNGITNGTNAHINGVQITHDTSDTNGSSHTNDFPSLTPTTSSPSVNHLVSSNGYYGYHHSRGQTSSTCTTSSASKLSSVHASSSDMDMDDGQSVASTSNGGFGGVNLLTDASVSQDLVPVAGKKRVREDDHMQQSKRGRFQVEEERRLQLKDSTEGALEGARREPFQNITNHSSGGFTFLPRLPQSINESLPNPFITASSLHAHLYTPSTPVTNHHPITAPLFSPSLIHPCNLPPSPNNRSNSRSSFSANYVTDGRTSQTEFDARASDGANSSSATVIPLLSTNGIPHQHAAGICPSSCFLKVSSAFYSEDVPAVIDYGSSESLMLSPKYLKWFPRHRSTLMDNVPVTETRLALGPERMFNYEKPYLRELPTAPDISVDTANNCTVDADKLTVDTVDRFSLPTALGPVSPPGWMGSSASVDDGFHGTTASQWENISDMFLAIHGCEMYIEERDLDFH